MFRARADCRLSWPWMAYPRQNRLFQALPVSATALLMIGASGCHLSTYNSFSEDASRYAPEPTIDPNDPASVRFGAVRAIIKSRCVSCHGDFPGYTQDQWIQYGYVVAGSPDTSLLYGKLRGSGAPGDQDMPPDGPLLSTDVQAFNDWITGL